MFGFGCAGGIAEKLSEETNVSPFCSFSVHYPAQGGGIKIRQWPSVDQHSMRDVEPWCLKRPGIVAWRRQLASLHSACDLDSDVVQLDRFWLRVADRCGDGGQRSCCEVQCRIGLTLSHGFSDWCQTVSWWSRNGCAKTSWTVTSARTQW